LKTGNFFDYPNFAIFLTPQTRGTKNIEASLVWCAALRQQLELH